MKLNRYNYLVMAAHTACDINQGALPAILPFLILHNNLSYTSAAGLMFAANFISAAVQPLFGYLGDRASYPWLMSLGIVMAGSGLAAIGFLENYWLIFFAAMLSGVGIAIFHPEGGRMTNLISGGKSAQAMSFFIAGGNLGFALGPLLVSFAFLSFGGQGSAVLFVPAALMSGLLILCQKNLRVFNKKPPKEKQAASPAQADDWLSFFRVSLLLICRSIMTYGLMTFIPLYWINILKQSAASGNAKLTVFSLSNAAATILGGYFADKYGYGKVVKGSFFTLLPVLLLLLNTGDALLATLLILPLAFSLNLSFGSLVTLGQGFLPGRLGMASGIMLGANVSIGGLSMPGLGWIGDHYGLTAAMYAIAAVSASAILFTFVLPKPRMAKAMP
ncbi:MAG: MFS transporter [Acidaminococcales bacterium]|nr:MFS transporter [Acidaminococcales bacterium]